MKVKGFCEHCGKTRTYIVATTELIDDYTKCKFCGKSGNVVEVTA